ncbi:hypothetical protein CLI64_18880 [Nostoc sp. CENA543]|uniref:hypothetical protein n=1 Tax=Nostoc sp. CENA543 TaxID=1869241 RepID=UPI000CA0B4C8|nr:hypothetical protein [Nostoc sp. CENA543]AUT02285.1 hypothetical protein CLI64_18880 [Nostoc sp. CENA543]
MEKYSSQIQIDDLIDNAINNAIARRHEGLGLSELSNEQARNIAGGFGDYSSKDVLSGMIGGSTVGIIAVPDPTIPIRNQVV